MSPNKPPACTGPVLSEHVQQRTHAAICIFRNHVATPNDTDPTLCPFQVQRQRQALLNAHVHSWVIPSRQKKACKSLLEERPFQGLLRVDLHTRAAAKLAAGDWHCHTEACLLAGVTAVVCRVTGNASVGAGPCLGCLLHACGGVGCLKCDSVVHS